MERAEEIAGNLTIANLRAERAARFCLMACHFDGLLLLRKFGHPRRNMFQSYRTRSNSLPLFGRERFVSTTSRRACITIPYEALVDLLNCWPIIGFYNDTPVVRLSN